MSRTTLATLANRKRERSHFACLTAYDASFAAQFAAAGVELLLVGDSLGNVIQGANSTLAVSLDDIIYHTRAVCRGAGEAMVMVDLPFLSYATPERALDSVARVLREGGGQVVKLEGGAVMLETVRTLSDRGIPVCAHLGLLPQSVHKSAGYRVQGRDETTAQQMIDDAVAMEQAGADLLLLELIPQQLAQRIDAALTIPTIGIGAGAHVTGQVLVSYDMLGITPGRRPRFSRDFLVGRGSVAEAAAAFVAAVRDGSFPAADETFD